MTIALAMVIVVVVAAFVVLPLLGDSDRTAIDNGAAPDELWTREKAVAVLAITEADFDLATGKLSDEDYRVLRSDYEGRALHAMDELGRTVSPVTAGVARYCAGCGAEFATDHAYCASCGRRREL